MNIGQHLSEDKYFLSKNKHFYASEFFNFGGEGGGSREKESIKSNPFLM